MSDATGVFLYSRVMSFANCSVIHPPASELELCAPTGGTDSLGIAQAYIWTPPTPLDYFPPPKFSPVPNQLGEDFAIRAIEAQPFDYVKAVVHDTVMAFGWKRIVFPQAATYDEYLFGTRSLPIPNWDRVDLGKYHTYASFYVRGNPLTGVVNPFATIIRVYQEYVWLPGTVYCLILLAGLGGIVLAWRRLGGEALLPWGISFAMILVPAATAEFDYRYVLPAVPFACLAAVMAFSRGTAGRDALTQLTGLGRAEGTVDTSSIGIEAAPPAPAVDSGDDERDLAADGA
jgi:hypothetical protein